MKYTYDDICKIANARNYKLISGDYNNCKTKILLMDSEGYKVYATADKLVNKDGGFRRFHRCNNYSIENINHYAKINGLKSKCISAQYISSKKKLLFLCACGDTFETTRNNFMSFHKTKCSECTGYHNKFTYEDVKSRLETKGYFLTISENDFLGITKSELTCLDKEGYKYNVVFNKIMRNKFPDRFNKSNKYALYNINHYLNCEKINAECISDSYIDNETPLVFQCKKCGEIIKKSWLNLYKNRKRSKFSMFCPNCDDRTESIHALVLKQMFKHYYPETIEEDRSCINPCTGRALPTDIVNHNLKIAVEIQSQWHDFEDRKIKDVYKKNFWVDKGYKFYDPDIRDYSILEMCQLFFDVTILPEWINYEYSNKLNIKEIQEMLDKGLTPPDIEKNTGINRHRIYDAIYARKLTRNNITKIPRDCGGSYGNI